MQWAGYGASHGSKDDPFVVGVVGSLKPGSPDHADSGTETGEAR